MVGGIFEYIKYYVLVKHKSEVIKWGFDHFKKAPIIV
jgi:hypothetical protein